MSSLHDWPSFSLGGLAYAVLRLYAVVVVGLHVGLLLYSETWRGKLVLLTTLALALSPLVGAHWTRKSRRALLASWGMLVLLSLACVVINVPDGKSRPGSLVSNRFVDDDWLFPRYALSNLVPEIEQIKWGVALAPYVDPIIDQAQARRIAGVTLPLYRQEDHFLLFSQPDAVLNALQEWLDAID